MDKYIDDIKKFTDTVNTELVEKLVSRLSIILDNKDASLVSCSDETELETVKKNFVNSKLNITDDTKTDAAIKVVCEKMADTKMKSRVTFYYLLAVELGAESTYINA